jgi:hypothetical protein
MKIIAYNSFKPNYVWRLWKAGIVRENYARADEVID